MISVNWDTTMQPMHFFVQGCTLTIPSLNLGWMPLIASVKHNNAVKGVHYKIFPNKDLPKLTDAESKILRDGLELYDLNLHDLAVAVVRSSHILGKWREEISKAVSEGEDYAAYSNILLPSPKTEPEKMAMRLLHFKRIDTNNLCPVVSKKKSKEEEALEITKQLVYTTKKAEPIFLTAYLSSSKSETDDDSTSEKQTSPDTAIKKKTNEWHVYLENDQFMTATDEDLLDSNKFFVQRKCLDNDETTKKKQSAKQKRARRAEKIEKEKTIREKGLERRREVELEQYNNLCKRFKSGAAPYKFEEFLDLVDLI